MASDYWYWARKAGDVDPDREVHPLLQRDGLCFAARPHRHDDALPEPRSGAGDAQTTETGAKPAHFCFKTATYNSRYISDLEAAEERGQHVRIQLLDRDAHLTGLQDT